MKNIKVYCIVVTYNAMKWIDKCLGSLRTSSAKIYPVIVDNNSKDETVTYIKQYYPEVYLIQNNNNKGFGQANNQGIEYAYKQGATHFFLLNQDAWVQEDTIEKLITIQDKYSLALVSPIHLNGNGDLLDYNYFSQTILSEYNIEYVSDLILNRTKPYYTVFKINGAAWVLSRKTIEQIGGFDPLYFHYGEDGNYCQRIKYHKRDVAFVPSTYMHHDRIKQGNMETYKKNATMMMLLLLYSDINHSVWKFDKKRIKLHLANFVLGFSLLLRLKFKEFANLSFSYIKFIVSFPKMLYHMNLNKQIGHNWLNLTETNSFDIRS
jgi:GT2 family glycosyltransferase